MYVCTCVNTTPSQRYYNEAQATTICRVCRLPWTPARPTEQPTTVATSITCPACIEVNAAFAGFEDGAAPRPSSSCTTCGGSGVAPIPNVDGDAGVGAAVTPAAEAHTSQDLPSTGSSAASIIPLGTAAPVAEQPAEAPQQPLAPQPGASAGVGGEVITISSYVATKGRRLFIAGAVRCLSVEVFQVSGDTGERLVDFLTGAARCNCIAGLRGINCSHVEAVRLWGEARLAEQRAARKRPPADAQ